MRAGPGRDGPEGSEHRSPDNHPGLRAPSGIEGKFEFGLWIARGFVIIPVVVLILASLGAFVYGVDVFVRAIFQVYDHPHPAQRNIGYFLLLIDLFLIGATMLIAAIGLYELFISRVDPRGMSQLPAWLQMHDLNDLKGRVIAMIVLVSAVTFIDLLVNITTGWRTLRAGIGISLVILALTAFIRFGAGGSTHRS